MEKYLNELKLQYLEVVEKLKDYGLKGGGVSDMPRGGLDPYALEKLFDRRDKLKRMIGDIDRQIILEINCTLKYLAEIENEKIEQVYILRHVKNYGWKKISDMLNITESAAKKRYYRFLKNLEF